MDNPGGLDVVASQLAITTARKLIAAASWKMAADKIVTEEDAVVTKSNGGADQGAEPKA